MRRATDPAVPRLLFFWCRAFWWSFSLVSQPTNSEYLTGSTMHRVTPPPDGAQGSRQPGMRNDGQLLSRSRDHGAYSSFNTRGAGSIRSREAKRPSHVHSARSRGWIRIRRAVRHLGSAAPRMPAADAPILI